MFERTYLIFICALSAVESARILAVLPTPSVSHHIVFRPFTEELVKRGHEVVVITADPAYPKGETPVNLTEIDVHDAAYLLRDRILAMSNDANIQNHIETVFQLIATMFENVVTSDQVHKFLQGNDKFDLLVLEVCVRSTVVFSHFFKAPVILFSSFGTMEYTNYAIGAPTHPLLYPTLFHKRLFDLTFAEKMTEVYNYYSMIRMDKIYEEVENKMLKKYFGPDLPSLRELNENIDMVFLNVHPIWEHNRPMPPNVVFLGGLQLKTEKELPKDLKTYLDSSKHGVIYISFGTNVSPSMLPPKTVQAFVKVFSQLPYDVLWKWDKDDLPGRSDNIRIEKWLPQSDLLRHPKVKLFITQGGLQSTDEAIIAGVPMIGIPMLGDQWANVEKYVHHRIGLRLDIGAVTEDILRNAITAVIEDESYRQNILKLRAVMIDQPQPPLERAMWWTEYIIRHGGAKHLRAPAANMTWAQYLEIDLVVALLTALLCFIVIVAGMLYYLVSFLSRILTNIKVKIN